MKLKTFGIVCFLFAAAVHAADPIANTESYINGPGVFTADAANGVLANDTDADGDTLEAVLVETVSNGHLTFNSDGSFTYYPNSFTLDFFVYLAYDGANYSDPVMVHLSANGSPSTDPAAFTLDNNSVEAFQTPGAVVGKMVQNSPVDGAFYLYGIAGGGDQDEGGAPFEMVGDTLVTRDVLNTFPFHYKVRVNMFNSAGQSFTENFVVLINKPNAAPVAANDGYSLDEGATLTVNAQNGVLANDSDATNDALTANLVSGPAHGNLTLNADGSFTYVHDSSDTTSDSFTYTANDGKDSNTATVTFSVNPVPDGPTNLTISNATVDEAAPFGTVVGTLSADHIDPNASLVYLFGQGDGDEVQLFTIFGNQLLTNTVFDYETDTSINVEVVVFDQLGQSARNTFTISINDVNEAPIAAPDSYETSEGLVLSVSAPSGVLANDFDENGDALTAVLANGPIHGSLTLNADGSFLYTHNGSETTSDSFTYTANDGDNSNPVTVSLNILPVNDAPTNLNLSNITVAENQTGAAVGTFSTIDIDSNTHSYTLVSGSGFNISGDLLSTTTAFDFESQANHNIRVRTTDDMGASFERDFTITVTDANDAPSFTSSPNTAAEGNSPYTYQITTADPDAGDTLTVSAASLPAWLTLSGAVLSGTPDAADDATYAIQLTVTDAAGASAQQNFSLTVTPNQAPVIYAMLPVDAMPNVALNNLVIAEDPDQTNLTYAWTFGDGATGTGNPAAHTYTAMGTYDVTVTVTDEAGISTSQTTAVTVHERCLFMMEEARALAADLVTHVNSLSLDDISAEDRTWFADRLTAVGVELEYNKPYSGINYLYPLIARTDEGTVAGIDGLAEIVAIPDTVGDVNNTRNELYIMMRELEETLNVWIDANCWMSEAPNQAEWMIVGTTDFDANGSQDLLWEYGNGLDHLIWLMDGEVQLDTVQPTNTPGFGYHVVDAGHFDSDNLGDILWKNLAVPGVLVQPGDQSQSFSLYEPYGAAWQFVAAEDFNNDGVADFLWYDNAGDQMWTEYVFADKSQNYVTFSIVDYNGLAPIGITGDANLEILWQDGSGQYAVSAFDGQSATGNIAVSGLTLNSDWQVEATADMDGDGHLDLLLRSGNNITVAYLQNGVVISEFLLGSIVQAR